MGWLEELQGKLVCLDTAPIIYYMERGHPGYKKMLDPFFDMVGDGKCSVVTLIISLLEGLVMPIRNNDVELVRGFRDFFYHTHHIKTIEVTSEIAEESARIRASYTTIKTPDAIQIATAISSGASVFLTNDLQLASIPDSEVLVLDKLKTDS